MSILERNIVFMFIDIMTMNETYEAGKGDVESIFDHFQTESAHLEYGAIVIDGYKVRTETRIIKPASRPNQVSKESTFKRGQDDCYGEVRYFSNYV